LLTGENETIRKIFESCSNRIIHVDNPSLDVEEEEIKEAYLKRRNDSRKKILDHLSSDQCKGRYKLYPKTADQLYLRIANYIKRKLELEKELEDVEKSLKNNLETVEKVAEESRIKIKSKLKDLKDKVIEETVMELGEDTYNYFVEVPTKDHDYCKVS